MLFILPCYAPVLCRGSAQLVVRTIIDFSTLTAGCQARKAAGFMFFSVARRKKDGAPLFIRGAPS